jgi:hypothetical protein
MENRNQVCSKRQRVLIHLILVTIIISCKPNVIIHEYTISCKKQKIILGKISLDETIKMFGQNFTRTNINDYSYEYLYDKSGFAFSHQQQDSLKLIKWFNAKTNKNRISLEDKYILNSRSTVKDIVDVFGTGTWDYDSTYNGLIIEYDYFDFVIKLDSKDKEKLSDKLFIDDWSTNYSRFKNYRISKVEVY